MANDDNTSQVGSGQVGDIQVGADQSGIYPVGFSRQAFGTPLVGGQLGPSGFTRRAFGTAQVNFNIDMSGFTRRAFGTPTLQGKIDFTGDGISRRAFGTATIDFQIHPSGFSRRAFGTAFVEDSSHIFFTGFGFTRRAFGTPQVNFQLHPSGFTRRAFGTPTISVTTQVDFFRRGITRQAFGTPGIQGGDPRLSCYIQGVQHAAYLEVQTATITKQLQTVGTAQVHLLVPQADSFRPALGNSLLIQEFGQRKFAGIVNAIDQNLMPGSFSSSFTGGMFDFLIDCVDYNYLADRKVVALLFNPDYLVNHINRILGQVNFLGEGLSAANVDPTIYVADALDFSSAPKPCREVFNQFALSTDTVWWIDDFKVINFISISSARSSSYSITDNGKQVDTIHVKKTLDNYRNVEYVRSTSNILTKAVTLTDSHTFNGTDIVCPTTYPLTGAPDSVLENGVEIVGTSRFFELKLTGPTAYPPSGSGWYWISGDYGVWYWPSSSRPSSGTTLAVKYTGVQTPTSNIVIYKDSSEITSMAAATGGNGLFEDAVDFSGSATYDELIAYAKGMIAATAPPPLELDCNTIEQIEGLGFAVAVNLSAYGLNTTLIIQKYIAKADATDLGKGSHFITSLVLVSAKTLGDWRSYWERVLARLNAVASIPPTVNPTWQLAFDSGSNVSPGLSVGPMGAPWPVTVNTATIVGVSVLFKDAPDAVITLDFLLNGVSILDGAKIKYQPGNSPSQIIYANLVTTTCKQGDVFEGKILTTGVVNPGKNGVATVILAPR